MFNKAKGNSSDGNIGKWRFVSVELYFVLFPPPSFFLKHILYLDGWDKSIT